MSRAVELVKDVYWVGVVDWDLRYFHGYSLSTHRGTTYNAYLVCGEKTALVDTVFTPFAGELLQKISDVVDPSRIDYVVSNHVEVDHSGALPAVMEQCPQAQVLCSKRGLEGLKKNYYRDWDFRVVKTGDELSLGNKTLSFLEAPMLHWPDSMFTYLKEEALLMPNDAFGQHFASSARFDDEVDLHEVVEEAEKYYANILYPFSRLVLKKLEEVQKLGLEIKMIAPSHGIIWRQEPEIIIDAYRSWASGEARPKVVLAYDTMWGSTEQMARSILEGLVEGGVEVQMRRVPLSDANDIIKELLNAGGILVGSSTIHRNLLPTVAPLLEELTDLKPVGKIGAAFGSSGWNGGAVEKIEKQLSAAGIEIAQEGLDIRWVPDESEQKRCFEFGREFAEKVLARVSSEA